ncbi:tipN [Brevundimonas sp.]|uniref:tipN n=1 Tax=Brevundimonas sp. TaxID=1871086 RepID=UPI002635F355|nr:tipN [Brevundimonas sp.]
MMKNRQRPPLNLTAPEAETAAVDAAGAATSAPTDRPMSERRRRRLAEQARLDHTVPPMPEAVVEAVVEVDLSTTSRQAPAPIETPAPPAVDLPETRPEARPAPTARPVSTPYGTAAIAAGLWAAGIAALLAYEAGFGAVELEPLRLAAYALIALAPAGLAFLLARTLGEAGRLAAETRLAHGLSEALVAPTALAAREAGGVLSSLREDVDQAALAAERARRDMSLLREALSEETRRLNQAAETATATARRLAEALGQEREAMASLAGRLDGQATAVVEAVERQSRMVMDASDLAQTQLREAEAALAARAADMAAAAGEAQDAARAAADDLARQTLRLENAGSGVAEQIQSVEEGLGQQRAALVTAAYALRTDQEDFSAQVESQRAQLTEQLSAARTTGGELVQTSAAAAETARDLVEAATDQFRALIDMAQREAESFDAATKMALDRFEALAADARDLQVEETRRALEALKATAEAARASAAEAAGDAQHRADRLGEALFAAAHQADQAADARVEGARRVVVETAGLVDEAGARAIERLEATISSMGLALERVDAAMQDLDRRAADLPEVAQKRVDAVRAAVEQGLEALSAASRKAAEDTEALDAGFQERVRRNYEMLTEAVRLMGVVSGDGGGRRRDASTPTPPPAPKPAPPATPTTTPAPDAQPPSRSFGLRRLQLNAGKLPPPGPAAPDRIGWSDLEDDAPLDLDTPMMPTMDVEALSARVVASIRRMGVDPNALLPRARIEEAALAIARGDSSAARAVVRRVAPAAVRSVSRRVLSDAELRADAEAYVAETARVLADHARGGDPAAVLNRLASDGGRAFMLLDAAVGDLA